MIIVSIKVRSHLTLLGEISQTKSSHPDSDLNAIDFSCETSLMRENFGDKILHCPYCTAHSKVKPSCFPLAVCMKNLNPMQNLQRGEFRSYTKFPIIQIQTEKTGFSLQNFAEQR